MKLLTFLAFFIFYFSATIKEPVLKNSGIPSSEHYKILDHIDNKIGYVIASVDTTLEEKNGKKYYSILVKEGDVFLIEIELNYSDLTTVSEKRTDIKNKCVIESYTYQGNNKVLFINKEKNINKVFNVDDANIYSRYAYFVSFRGFPFEIGKSVYFKTFMFEYGNALPMKLSCIALQKVKVKTGAYDCYKLELTVSGWQSIFASDKYYLYFKKDAPHLFIKYEETTSEGTYANELFSIN